ncbi:apolipophorin-like [Xenentodon cancila]
MNSQLLQELSEVPLQVTKRAEALLDREDRGLLGLWHRSPLRHILTSSLPRFLSLLQHASLLGQQELRRPLATLAGVYQDVTGQSLEEMRRETILMWTDTLVDVLDALLENPHLKTLSQAAATGLTAALDMAGQQTYYWTESRSASALSGVRKQLSSLYKFSPRECAVSISVSLPHLSSLKVAEAGLMEVLLEEWVLRPLQALTSVRPTAEFYRLKRKIMDSPFIHQALLVADQFVVTFDGHLYELPASCPRLLAQDVGTNPKFTLALNRDSETFLLMHVNNHTINIQHTGEVKVDCNTVAHEFSSDDGLTVSRGSSVVQVSSKHGASLSCDLSFELCSFTLDGWSHGASTGLLGTNDNDPFNDFPLRDGSQAAALEDFFHSWEVGDMI